MDAPALQAREEADLLGSERREAIHHHALRAIPPLIDGGHRLGQQVIGVARFMPGKEPVVLAPDRRDALALLQKARIVHLRGACGRRVEEGVDGDLPLLELADQVADGGSEARLACGALEVRAGVTAWRTA